MHRGTGCSDGEHVASPYRKPELIVESLLMNASFSYFRGRQVQDKTLLARFSGASTC